jgi:hypothetical protein
VHMPQLRCLDGVVGIKGARDPMVAVIVSTSCYLHFVSYALTLTTFCTISLHKRRLSSCILPWVCSDVPLDVGSISCIVGDVVDYVGSSVGWSIGRSISCNVGNGVGRLHHFVFTSSLFSHRFKGPWLRRRWRGCSDLLLE